MHARCCHWRVTWRQPGARCTYVHSNEIEACTAEIIVGGKACHSSKYRKGFLAPLLHAISVLISHR
eukprot:1158562-Pelagomonas_calceolata.AAC.11